MQKIKKNLFKHGQIIWEKKQFNHTLKLSFIIIGVSIMDKRWNYNDKFWNDILLCLYNLKETYELFI